MKNSMVEALLVVQIHRMIVKYEVCFTIFLPSDFRSMRMMGFVMSSHNFFNYSDSTTVKD